jgi:hypothetical protein
MTNPTTPPAITATVQAILAAVANSNGEHDTHTADPDTQPDYLSDAECEYRAGRHYPTRRP